ncbi:Skp1 family protein [uncultured virus]|nr:Skp1 family protein [uncultured virus]
MTDQDAAGDVVMTGTNNGAASADFVRLQTCDDHIVTTTRSIACLSVTVKNILCDLTDCGDAVVPLPNVKKAILDLVLRFCEHVIQSAPPASAAPVTSDSASTSTSARAVTPASEPEVDVSSSPKNTDLTAWEVEFCTVDQASSNEPSA